MSERRLLVISYHYPTDGAVGGLRWKGMTKYLQRQGWRCRTITAAPPPEGSDASVISVTPKRTLLDRYRDLRHRQVERKKSDDDAADDSAPSSNGTSLTGGIVRRLRTEAAMLLLLPDDARGWIARATKAARREIRRFRPHVVVSTGPPHSAHVVAMAATRGSGIPWFADLRDPWAWPVSRSWLDHPLVVSSLSQLTLRTLEKLVFGRCTAVLCSTRAVADALAGKFRNTKFHLLPNGVDPELLPVTGANKGTERATSIAHVGTIYGKRSLLPLVEVMGRLARENDLSPRLVAAGRFEGGHERALRERAEHLGVSDAIELLGQVPREEALELLATSSVGVVLAQDQEYQVPAKLYETVALSPSTIVLTEPGSASWNEALRVGAFPVHPEDIDTLTSLVSRAVTEPGSAGAPDTIYQGSLAHSVSRLLEESIDSAAAPEARED